MLTVKHILLFFLFLFTFNELKSQDFIDHHPRTGPDFERGFTFYLVLPSYMAAPSNINPLLVENGFPHIPRGNLNYGLGLNYRRKKIEPGVDFSLGNQVITNPFLNSELLRRPLTGNIYLNYHLFRYHSFTLFPFIGYSITGTNLILSQQSTIDDFDQILENPSTTVNLRHRSDGLLLGLGVSLAEHWVPSTGTFRLKFAYRIPSGSYPWESKFSNFNNSPLDSFPFFFIQFEMGFSANWKKGGPFMDKFWD